MPSSISFFLSNADCYSRMSCSFSSNFTVPAASFNIRMKPPDSHEPTRSYILPCQMIQYCELLLREKPPLSKMLNNSCCLMGLLSTWYSSLSVYVLYVFLTTRSSISNGIFLSELSSVTSTQQTLGSPVRYYEPDASGAFSARQSCRNFLFSYFVLALQASLKQKMIAKLNKFNRRLPR